MGARSGLLACVLAAGMLVVALGTAEAARSGGGMYVGGQSLPIVASTIEIDVRLGVAHGVVRQRFHNPRADAAEAIYVFPLPTGASVERMTARLGATTIEAAIAPRAVAAQRYEAAVAGGRAAALTEAERPGVFTQSLAPVPAGGEVEIELHWRAALVRRDGTWELAHPLVVGPRYVPGAATGKPTTGAGVVPDTDRAPDASRVTPPSSSAIAAPVRLVLALDDADAITSPSHALAIERAGDGARVALDDARGDREVVVRWTSRKAAQVRALVEPAGKGAYVAVLIEAERDRAAAPRAPRRWLVAIDRSPSLDGAAAAAARRVAHAILDGVGADEPVAVVAIGEALRGGPPLDRAATRRAIDTLPAGGSDLTRGLAATLANLPRDPAPEVVLVTDGLVADDAAAIERAVAAGVHVHTVGVGGAPNRWLLGAIAQRTGATAGVLTSVDDAPAIAATILGSDRAVPVTVDWRSPSVTDVEASDPRIAPGAATLLVAFDPTGVPRGEVVVAIGSRKLRAPLVAATGTTLAATWAGLRVRRLWAAGDRDGATRLALARGVLAPTTALVASATGPGGDPVRSTISVPVPMPVGARATGVHRERVDSAEQDRDDAAGGEGTFVLDAKPTETDAAKVGAAKPKTAPPAPPTVPRPAPEPPPPPAPPAGNTATIELETGGAGSGATASEEPADAPAGDAYARPGRVLEDVEAVAQGSSLVGRDTSAWLLNASLGLGARLGDERAPAALLSVGAYRRLPRFFAAGLRLDLTAAPTVDDPLTAAGLFSFSSSGRGLLRVDGGVGLGWAGEVAAAYQLGLFAGKDGLGLSLRLSGFAATDQPSSTVGVGVEASF